MSQKYLEITGKVVLPHGHREAANLTSSIDEILKSAEQEIAGLDGLAGFEFDAKPRTERPNLRGPRKAPPAEPVMTLGVLAY